MNMKKLGLCAIALAASLAVAGTVELADVTPVEYIQSSEKDSQFINIGIEGGGDLEIETKLQWITVPSDGCFLAARGPTGSDNRYYAICYGSGHFYLGYKTYTYTTSPTAVTGRDYVVNTVMLNGSQTMSVNGETVLEQAVAGPFTSGRNLYLFALNSNGRTLSCVSARCYYLKIYDRSNGGRELIADMIPCIDAQGQPGLYDKVRKAVYLNGGNGRFTFPDVFDHYVEYIQSSGREYIDTGLTVRQAYGTSTKFSFDAVPDSTSDACMLGGRSTKDARMYCVYYYNGTFCYANGTLTELDPKYPTTVGVVNTVQTELFQDVRRCTINGKVQTPVRNTQNPIWTDAGFPLYVFALNNIGNPSSFAKAKCYGVKIWTTDDETSAGTRILLRDLRPCVTIAGDAAMYDRVSGEIFKNKSSTGAFVAGPQMADGSIIFIK